MTIYMLFALLGGLGLFLYGMNLMSDALESMAGNRMRRILEMLTKNRFTGALVGTVATGIVQSSSAITVMLVGFVNANLMTLTQAAGVIVGSNIGTTVTSQLIAFDLSKIAPFILFVGMVMALFLKKRKFVKIGLIILGFGMLFVGLNLMSEAMAPLREIEAFTNFLVNFRNPIVGVLVGAIFTAVIQSSSASVGILQAFAMMGLVGLDQAVYVILGQNIGTCITTILASIGTSANSKRTAGFHLSFNVIGTVVFLIVLAIAPQLVTWVESLSPTNVSRQIANFHTLFNLSMTILLLPFTDYLVNLVIRLIPEKADGKDSEKKLVYLNQRLENQPNLAISATMKELHRMGEIAGKNYNLSIEAFFDGDENKVDKVKQLESTVDYLSDSITKVMIELRGLDLHDKDLVQLGKLHHTIIDLERISDRSEDIAEFALLQMDVGQSMTKDAIDDLTSLTNKVNDIIQLSLDIFSTLDQSKMDSIRQLRSDIEFDKLACMDRHIVRLQKQECTPQVGVIFTNILTSLERIASHSMNIANSVNFND